VFRVARSESGITQAYKKLGEKAIEKITKRLDSRLRDFLKVFGEEAVVHTRGVIGHHCT
jgi:hypothetical protein